MRQVQEFQWHACGTLGQDSIQGIVPPTADHSTSLSRRHHGIQGSQIWPPSKSSVAGKPTPAGVLIQPLHITGDAGVGSPDTVVQVSDTSQLHIIHHDGHRPDLGMPMCYACMTWRCLAAVTFRIRALSEINQRIYLNFPTRRHTKKNIASYCFSF